MSQTRIERDSMGELPVPSEALYGASTQRAVLNFPVSGYRLQRPFIRALGLIKQGAARANGKLGRLPEDKAALIAQAAEPVINGQLDSHFVVDVFQTGSATSTNMNANEVIANQACLLESLPIGSKESVHPNDHVNMGQSSNDVIPTALHIALADLLCHALIPALDALHQSLHRKAQEFHPILKIGRTHLMDATPVRLGQEFGGYARQMELAKGRIGRAVEAVEELALGGTAVGTGLNTHVDFPALVIAHINDRTGLNFREAADHFEAQGAKDGVVEASGLMKTVAISLFKIANDIRWLSSGPRCGLGEIRLPSTQPGSSIMPGKVNPVMCEAVMQVCSQVIGNDAAICWGGANGNLELNVMMPMMAYNSLESARLLANVCQIFRTRCVDGLIAQEARCNELVEYSMAMVTSLAPIIGYDLATEIAKESDKTGRTVREICLERQILPEAQLKAALDPLTMTAPDNEGPAAS